MYDYWLGGRDNYQIDRDAGERILATMPRLREAVRANREFLRRTVGVAIAGGIRQILDIGTGIPTSPNTHEIAQSIAPETKVVYVDKDPVVGAYARARLAGQGNTAFTLGDLREPEAILNDPIVGSLIDWDRPVAILLIAVLHFVNDHEQPHRIVETLREALPRESYLVLSHGTRETLVHDTTCIESVYRTHTELIFRSHVQIHGFLEGFEILEPGLVAIDEWRPEPGSPKPTRFGLYGAVGRKV